MYLFNQTCFVHINISMLSLLNYRIDYGRESGVN